MVSLQKEAVMNSSEEELSEDEEEVADDGRHINLLTAMSKMSSKGRGKSQLRSEPGAVSEFGLSTSGEGVVEVRNLLNSLQKNQDQVFLKKQLKSIVSKKKTLDIPLYSHEAEKIQRTVAYKKVSKDIGKWDQVVKTNRKVEHMSFPLNQAKIGLQSTEDFAQRFKPTTPLEEEIYKLLNGNKYAETKDKELTRAEEEVLSAMSLEEAQIRRAELQKSRALQSYYESKCKRQKRIKSKKYHRIKRKGKAKEEVKRMEEMMKTDPGAAAEELTKMEKIRAEERMNLRHKNTGKWAKGMMRFGKYSLEARQKIADQLDENRVLTQKIAEVVEDEDGRAGDADRVRAVPLSLSDVNNPWFTGKVQTDEEKKRGGSDGTDGAREAGKEFSRPKAVEAEAVDDSENEENAPGVKKGELDGELERLRSKRKLRSEEAQRIRRNGETSENMSSEEDEEEDEEEDGAEGLANELEEGRKEEEREDKKGRVQDDALGVGLIDEETTRKNTEEDFESITEMEEVTPSERLQEEEGKEEKEQTTRREGEKSSREEANVDPSKVFTLKPKNVITVAPDLVVEGDGMQESDHLMNIQQAFEDDDVIDEFKAEKEAAIEKGKPKPVDLTLPGWGSWGGTGVKPSKKKKRFIRQAPPAAPRKDDGLHHVIINEDRDRKISLHQVRDLPYPFSSVEQFQGSIRAPIGDTWNTPSAVAKLTKPSYSTKLGTIIEPIQEEVLKKGANKRRNRPKPDIELDGPKSKRVKSRKIKDKRQNRGNERKATVE